jgi:hypothetical protein
MLLFIDESGHDHREMPYEVLAAVSVAEDYLWNLVQAIRSAEREKHGIVYLDDLRGKADRDPYEDYQKN